MSSEPGQSAFLYRWTSCLMIPFRNIDIFVLLLSFDIPIPSRFYMVLISTSQVALQGKPFVMNNSAAERARLLTLYSPYKQSLHQWYSHVQRRQPSSDSTKLVPSPCSTWTTKKKAAKQERSHGGRAAYSTGRDRKQDDRTSLKKDYAECDAGV